MNRNPSRISITVQPRKTRRYQVLSETYAVKLQSQSSLWMAVESSTPSTLPTTLLLVAGDSMHTQLVKMVLSTSGYGMQTCPEAQTSGFAGAVETPSVVLLDWDTDGIVGNAVLRGLRRNPQTRNVPVIVMTNRAVSPRWLRELTGRGVKWILEKPIVALSLPKLIERTIAETQKSSQQGCQIQRSALLIESGQSASDALSKAVVA